METKEDHKDKLYAILDEKGLFFDEFDILDEYFQLLRNFNSETKRIAEALNKDVLEDFSSIPPYDLPFNKYEIEKLDDKYISIALDKADKIKSLISSKFPNIEIDDHDFHKFVSSQEEFNAQKIIFYLIENYGLNEDLISLTQIQEKVRKSLPYTTFDPITTVDEIIKVGKNGMKFETYNEYNIKAIAQFAQIVIGKEYPSYSKGCFIREGESYNNDPCFKSIHFYKKGNVTILFYDESHLKKFSEAIFKPPEEIMEMIK